MSKINFVCLVIENLSPSFEVEMDSLGNIECEIYLLPKEKREQIENFEEKVIKDLYESSFATFKGREDWFKNINENLKESRECGEGIPSVKMTPKQYDDFLIKFEEYKKQYNEIKKSIISDYDEIVNSFKEGFKESFPHAVRLLDSIPSKEDFDKFQIKIVYEQVTYSKDEE